MPAQKIDPLASALDRIARIEALCRAQNRTAQDIIAAVSIEARAAHADLLAASLGAE